ncbi:MAG: asparaginase [Vicinamibacterales bacterium]|nr:asparaginase [Vicinamibacterales bacterium]
MFNVRSVPALVFALVLVMLPSVAAAQAPAAPLPKVLVIGTGGTIAGVQDRPGTLDGYRAGEVPVNQIVAGVPEVARFAEIESEQFLNTASGNILPEHWLSLSKRVNQLLRDRRDLAGIVVTHGTDRMEETAFFLYLTVKSDRPVVFVGAQHPATGISPDGPANLLAAVRVAAAPQSRGKGVTIVMDQRILSARESRKLYLRFGGFSTGEMGMLGVVAPDGPTYFFAPLRRQGLATEFDVDAIDTLPKVELVYSYSGGDGPLVADDTRGVVVATTGYAPGERVPFDAIRRAGTVLVQTFPTGEHVPGVAVRPATLQTDAAPPIVQAQHLLPQKCRILLMLALTRTNDPWEVQRIFAEY